MDVVSEIESLDLVFAREAQEALYCYGKMEEFSVYNKTAAYCLATPRIDIDTPSGGLYALRLRAMPTFKHDVVFDGESVMESEQESEPEQELMVLLLEGYDLPSDWADKYPDSEGLPWEAYVVAVINVEDKDVPLLLDARTGDELSEEDAFEAVQVLRNFKEAIRLAWYEEEDDDEIGQGFTIVANGEEEFEPGRYISGYACDECQLDYTHCSHKINLGSLN